jgi:hypothetical protein
MGAARDGKLMPVIQALLDTTKVVGKSEIDGQPFEICAEAVANHDRRDNRLTVDLRAFLRAEGHARIGETTAPDWLPAPETVTEYTDFAEAHEVAADVFANWCRRVAGAVTG